MTEIHIIRALQRGLQLLQALNENNGSTVSEIARFTGLPRTTAFRLLENLRAAEFVRRDPDERYRVTIKVRSLSSAFEESQWIEQVVAPVLDRLSGKLLWPIYVLTLFGDKMVIRATTTYKSPLAIDTLAPGTFVPLVNSGSGKAYLAFCGAEERSYILEILSKSGDSGYAQIEDQADFAAELKKIRRDGYALERRARMKKNPKMTTSIAVPVLARHRVIAVVSLRYTDAAMPLERAIQRFCPILTNIAGEIGSTVDESNGDLP